MMARAAVAACVLSASLAAPALEAQEPFVASSHAQTVRVGSQAGSGVDMTIETLIPVDRGYAAVTVIVANDSGRGRSWNLRFQANANDGSKRSSRFEIAAEHNGDRRRFELAVPLATTPGTLFVTVAGYGITGFNYPLLSPHYGAAGPDRSVAITASLVPSKHVLKDVLPETDLAILTSELPGDWRLLRGLDTFWMTESNWRRAVPRARAAIGDWVGTGGRLVIVREPRDERPAPATPGRDVSARELLAGAGHATVGHGFGAVAHVVYDLEDAASTEPFARALAAARPFPAAAGTGNRGWPRASAIEPPETRAGLLSLFFVGYALLIGPVNLVVFCRQGQRSRLFWTIPTIALAASVFLTALIVLQDGVGGDGDRFTVVHLVPEDNRAVLVQEQVARTGALLGSSFTIDPEIAVWPMGTAPEMRNLELESAAGHHFGEWFRSRFVQGHWLETVRPSRARVELVPGVAGPPEIVSSIDETLAELYYRDPADRVWYGRDIAPGRPQRLSAANGRQLRQFAETALATASPRMQALVRRRAAGDRSVGHFFARAAGDGAALASLASIDWRASTALYIGPVDGGEE